jgi:orotidine-5'-phosphate decarboxylase
MDSRESRTFERSLAFARASHQSLLCVGLDPEPSRLPAGLSPTQDGVYSFLREIVDATVDVVCAFKPNVAFFEALGPEGPRILEQIVEHINGRVPIICDAKRGDIANSAEAYAMAIFDHGGFDAVTVSPYLGRDSIEPFLRRQSRGVFVLCRTSNPGARDFQDLDVGGRPLFTHVAQAVHSWNADFGNCGLVVGATYPKELATVRAIAPDLPLLVPGIGIQGGDIEQTVISSRADVTPVVINVSRSVLYASASRDFAREARSVAVETRDKINSCVGEMTLTH